MEVSATCKYCHNPLLDCLDEGLQCRECKLYVHLRCLHSKAVPGDLTGDVFFLFTCQECSSGSELFVRDKMSWLRVVVLVLYHLQSRSYGLSKKGFFNWRNHIVSFIDKNWELLFQLEIKKKKKWMGTVAGVLSHFSNYIFVSGAVGINEPSWWALYYPKLSPNVVSKIYHILVTNKQHYRLVKGIVNESDAYFCILQENISNSELLSARTVVDLKSDANESCGQLATTNCKGNVRKRWLPSIETISKRSAIRLDVHQLSENSSAFSHKPGDTLSQYLFPGSGNGTSVLPFENNRNIDDALAKANNAGSATTRLKEFGKKLLDPMLHYNTALSTIDRVCEIQRQPLKLRHTTTQFRHHLILSPYSAIYLKPFIWRDCESYPQWLRLMDEIKAHAAMRSATHQYKIVDGVVQLPPRASLDFMYVQPEFIPAVNSLCNTFFWPGIDLAEVLQYPDFSCVVLYKRLIVAFAFMIPNVSYTENYVTFTFTRPGWRNCGIGKFMLYHLIQTSKGKDVTLHVSVNNPALCLYQKFGFKVESMVIDFYDKYIRDKSGLSKNAFFCRRER